MNLISTKQINLVQLTIISSLCLYLKRYEKKDLEYSSYHIDNLHERNSEADLNRFRLVSYWSLQNIIVIE